MKSEDRRLPESAGTFLKSCLVEGDPERQTHSQRSRRHAIVLSIALQSVAVAALIVVPLLGKGERIPVKIFVQRPPYRLGPTHPEPGGRRHNDARPADPFRFHKPNLDPSRPVNPNPEGNSANLPDDSGPGTGPEGVPDGVPNGLEPPLRAPKPPRVEVGTGPERHRVTIGHIDPARLTRRVEPIYPYLAIQIRREGRVELHAVIDTDGSIQSLEVLSGNPLFYQSALDAVREWRYTPTLLNGRAVEVDTQITVIYSMSH